MSKNRIFMKKCQKNEKKSIFSEFLIFFLKKKKKKGGRQPEKKDFQQKNLDFNEFYFQKSEKLC